MKASQQFFGLLVGGAPGRFDPVATVDDADPGTDGQATPRFWVDAVLRPLEGQTFGALHGRLDALVNARQVSTWSIRTSEGDVATFDGYLKLIVPDHSNGVFRCHLTLNGSPR